MKGGIDKWMRDGGMDVWMEGGMKGGGGRDDGGMDGWR